MRPDKYLLFIVIILVALKFNVSVVHAQWLQVEQATSTSYIVSGDIAVDDMGNVYTVGFFTGESYFDNDTISCHTDGDYFIAKYNSTGTLLWIKTAWGSSAIDGKHTVINGIAIGDSNTFYVTGMFPGNMLIDTILLSAFSQDGDILIAKFDSSGNCIWAKHAGGIGGDSGTDIEFDNDNNFYITGSINNQSDAQFDSITIPMSSTGSRFFLAKYDSNGKIIWVETSTGPGINYGIDISCYASYVYVSGAYDSVSVFDTINFISSGFDDIFILQYDSSGNIQWGRTASEPTSGDGCLSVSHDSMGNCYAIGFYNDTIYFDTTMLGSIGISDCFIAKYSFIGELLWVKQLYASEQAYGWSIKTDALGNSYISGEFKGTASFGNINLVSESNRDMFLAKYDSLGNSIGVRQVMNASGYGIALGPNGISYVTGILSDTAIFDAFTLYTDPFSSSNFWAKSGAITNINEEDQSSINSLFIYANPNQGKCSITVPVEFLHEKFLTLTIFDNAGRVIQNGNLKIEENNISINLQGEAKGIYCVVLSSSEKSYEGKLVLE